MRITDYRAWLKINGAKSGNISDKISNAKRIDEHYGNLDSHFNKDGLAVECQHVVHPPFSFEAGGFLPRAE